MMAAAFFSIAKAEARITLRNLGFWFYLFLIILLVNLVFVNSPNNPLRATIVQVVNNVLFFQFPLLAIVITPSLTRHKQNSREWIWSTQIDYPLLLAGQIFGFILLFFFAIVFIPCLVTFTWMAFENSSFMGFFVVWKFYTLLLLPVTFLQISIIVSITCLARNSIFSIAFVTAANILIWLGVLMPSASLLTPLNHTLLSLHFDPVAGLGAENKLITSLLFFYFSTGLWSLSVSVLLNALFFSREQIKLRSMSFLVVLVVLSTGVIFWAYGLHWSNAKQSIIPPPPTQNMIDNWRLVSESHTGSVTNNQLRIETELSVINTSNNERTDLFLSLNPGLACDKAKVNNEMVLCERKGEFVRLPLPIPIKSGEQISISLLYHGKLILAREDYSLAHTIRGYSPPSFQNPVYNYLQKDIIYLHRDGDWKVRPLSSFHPIDESIITLSVPYSDKIVSTGEIIQQDSSYITYQWAGVLPQVLLVSAPYIETLQSNDKIFLGMYSDKNDFDRATLLLTFKKSLDTKLGLSANSQQMVIMLPYLQELIFSDSIIGLPVKYSNQNDSVNTVYLLAREASSAWLIDKIAWDQEISTTGRLRSFERVCDEPDETGYQECRTTSLGKYNSQAPKGRIVYHVKDNNVRYALQTILGLDLLKNSSQHESFVKLEYESWVQKTKCNNDVIFFSADSQKARWITATYRLFNQMGEDGSSKLLRFLAEKYAPGSSPALTEQEFLQTLESFYYTKNHLPEFQAILSCSKSDNLIEEDE